MRWASILSISVGLLVCAPSAVATAESSVPGSAPAEPIPSPGAFYVEGSNGYTISVYADLGEKSRSRVLVSAAGSTGRVSVSAPADLSAEGIGADLGAYGRIDMSWQPNGQAEEGGTRCRSLPRTPIWFAGGEYAGVFAFRGEEGFTEVNVDAVDGRQGWWRYEGCGYTTSEGYPGPGILLEAERSRKHAARGAYRYFSIVQNRPDEKVSYQAEAGEARGQIRVYRAAYVLGGSGSLRVGEKLDRGEVRPPAPFHGRGVFVREKRGRPGTWAGNLTVDFPGRSGVSLTGRTWSARLMHGFRESEPLRLWR